MVLRSEKPFLRCLLLREIELANVVSYMIIALYFLAAPGALYLVGPFLAAYAAGFLFIGMLTLAHASGFSK